MADKIKVNYQGQEAWAERIPIRAAHENWNDYILDDGTTIKIKLVATDVLRVEGHYDGEGSPIYLMKTTNVISAIAPEELRKKEQ